VLGFLSSVSQTIFLAGFELQISWSLPL
jgi:hypothetical protein